jgi:4-carboxymuconolactone decarboxylase
MGFVSRYEVELAAIMHESVCTDRRTRKRCYRPHLPGEIAMLPPDPPARMPPLTPETCTAEANDMFERWRSGAFKNSDQNPVLWTFAHHPQLAELFSAFNIHLLSTSTLPVRQRQIAIMRTAWLCNACYMWSSHLRTSLRRDIEPELFGPLQVGASDPYFTAFERTVIDATEDLVRDRLVSDTHWQALAAQWNNSQLLDFLFTVGTHVLLAGVMRSTGVEREPELLELAEKYGAPA